MRILFTFSLTLFVLLASAQLSYFNQYQTTFGGNVDINIANDGSIYTLACTDRIGSNNCYALVLSKVSNLGETQWSKLYRFDRPLLTYAKIYLNNEALYISGTTITTGGNCSDYNLLVKLNLEGVPVRTTLIRQQNRYMNSPPTSIGFDSNGNLYYTTIGVDQNCGSGPRTACLISLDRNLNVRFCRKIQDNACCYGYTSVVGDQVIYNVSSRLHIFNTDGSTKTNMNKLSTTRYLGLSGRVNLHPDTLVVLGSNSSNPYNFNLNIMDKEGQILRSTPFYPGYCEKLQKDRFNNLYLLAFPLQAPNNREQHLFIFDSQLNPIRKIKLLHDSLAYGWETIPFCPELVRIHRANDYQNRRYLEFTLNLDHIGDVVEAIEYNPSETIATTRDTTFTVINVATNWDQLDIQIKEIKDTVFLVDTLSSYPACVTINLLPNDTLICNAEAHLVQAAVPMPDSVCQQSLLSYNWSNGSTLSFDTIRESGMYKITLDHAGCYYEDSIQVIINNYYNSLPPFVSTCLDNGVPYILTAEGDVTGSWNGTPGNTIAVSEAGNYLFEGLTAEGCQVQINSIINNRCDHMVYLPNSFSPDGDGYNEYFKPAGEGLTQWTLEIYNRWGEKIWTGNQTSSGWDGKDRRHNQVTGLFLCKLDYKEPVSMASKSILGHVMVVE